MTPFGLVASSAGVNVGLITMLRLVPFTKNAGDILFTRISRAKYNFSNHTVRSVVEMACWLTILFACGERFDDPLWSITSSSIASLLVCLASETMASMRKPKSTSHADRNTVVNVYLLLSVLYFMFTFAHRLLQDFISTIFGSLLLTGVCCSLVILFSDLLVKFEISARSGNVFFGRLLQVKRNWCQKPLRSLGEFAIWSSCLAVSYYLTRDAPAALAISLLAGIVVVLGSEVYSKDRKRGSIPPTYSKDAREQLDKILRTQYPDPLQPQYLKVKAPLLRKQGEYTMQQVATHNSKKDAWVVYDKKVYNLTKFLDKHPGGSAPILRFAGMDATDEIRAFHGDHVLANRMPNFQIGTVKDAPPPSQTQRDFRKLMAYAISKNMYTRKLSFYVSRLFFQFSLLGLVFALVACSDSVSVHMFGAVLLGFFFQQMAFVGHDIGHLAVFHDTKLDTLYGIIVGPLATGVGIRWWRKSHNTHHAVPNSLPDDPDIAHLPVFAVSSKMFENIFNTYHGRIMKFDWLAQNVFIPNQHYLFYPIMAFARFNLYLQTLIMGLKERIVVDLAAQAGFFCWMSALVSLIPTGRERFCFLLLSHAVAGLLNVQICLSHFSMPCNLGKEDAKGPYGGDFYTRNVVSSMDVVCSPGMDWFHGGLQFQTLHHCYPRLARRHLRGMRELIMALCDKNDIKYTQFTFVEGNKDIIRCLEKTAKEAVEFHPGIADALNAEG